MSQVKAENPDLSDADLMVQVSDRVKQAEAARRGRAADRVNEFPYELLRGQLVNGPGFLGVVPPPPRAVARPPPRYVDRFPDVEDFEHPLPLAIEDEVEQQAVAEAAHEEPDLEDLQPYPLRPLRYPVRYPHPSGYVFDRRYGMFHGSHSGIWFDPYNAHFYDLTINLGYDYRTGGYFPIIPPVCDQCHHQHCHHQHPNFHY